MSNIHTLKRWIREGEGPQLDFKTTITSQAKIAKSMVAFANSRGGKIVIGVEDKGFLVGVDVEGEKYELEKAANQFCSPQVDLQYQKIEHQGKYVLIAEVRESRQKPHYAFNKKKTNQQLYIRIGDECIVPPNFIEKMLKNGELNVTFRTNDYQRTKRELISYLKEKTSINPQEFATWQRISERNAKRMLIDYTFEGILKITDSKDQVFSLYN